MVWREDHRPTGASAPESGLQGVGHRARWSVTPAWHGGKEPPASVPCPRLAPERWVACWQMGMHPMKWFYAHPGALWGFPTGRMWKPTFVTCVPSSLGSKRRGDPSSGAPPSVRFQSGHPESTTVQCSERNWSDPLPWLCLPSEAAQVGSRAPTELCPSGGY